MRFEYKVEVEVERDSGKFASRADLGDAILTALQEADPGELESEEGSMYSIVTWEVTEA